MVQFDFASQLNGQHQFNSKSESKKVQKKVIAKLQQTSGTNEYPRSGG